MEPDYWGDHAGPPVGSLGGGGSGPPSLPRFLLHCMEYMYTVCSYSLTILLCLLVYSPL